MYKIKNTELDFESRIFHLHKIFYSAFRLEFFDDIDNLAEPFWDIGSPKTTPKYNLTQFSLHYPFT